MRWEGLLETASKARETAYAPYSGFRVGAAVATADGAIFGGANVENRSYGLSICAERVAVTAAVVAGHRRLAAVAVVTDASPPAMPCGPCLDTLSEFAEDLPVLLANLDGERLETTLRRLLPSPFTGPGRGVDR